jgi:hypothetical protein
MIRQTFPAGKTEVTQPVMGESYWVFLQTNELEICFPSRPIGWILRDHDIAPNDRTPTYMFDNGVIIHGADIRFFKEAPKEEGTEKFRNLIKALNAQENFQ